MDSILRSSAYSALGVFILSISQLPVALILEANRGGYIGLNGLLLNFLSSLGLFMEILLLVFAVLMYLGFARIAEKTKNDGLLVMSAIMIIQTFIYSVIDSLNLLSTENLVSGQTLTYLLFIEGSLIFVFGAGLLSLRKSYRDLGVLAALATMFSGIAEASIILYVFAALAYLPVLLIYAALLYVASKRY